MKLLVVSQYFYPENFRINDLCLELVKRGHHVTVLTGLPNYPEGELYKGYSYYKNREEHWNGIHIIRAPLIVRKKGSMHLILNYLSFAISASLKAQFMKLEKFEAVYVFETSPITVAFPAIVVKQRLHIPIIMNVQDLWPDNVIAVTGCSSPCMIYMLNQMVNYIYKKCDLILAASNGFVIKIQERLTHKEQVVFWPQYSIVEKTDEPGDLFDKNYFNIVFTGNLGMAQGLEMLIEAAKLCESSRIRWHLIGDGRNRHQLEMLVEKYSLQEQVLFHGRKEEVLIPRYLKSADAALLILKPDPIFDSTIPAKLQTYMACGVPILGCVNGEGKSLIKNEHIGITCEEISAMSLAIHAKKMVELPKSELVYFATNALKYSSTNFNKRKLIDYLEASIKKARKKYV